jgi:hypothetical protein
MYPRHLARQCLVMAQRKGGNWKQSESEGTPINHPAAAWRSISCFSRRRALPVPVPVPVPAHSHCTTRTPFPGSCFSPAAIGQSSAACLRGPLYLPFYFIMDCVF